MTVTFAHDLAWGARAEWLFEPPRRRTVLITGAETRRFDAPALVFARVSLSYIPACSQEYCGALFAFASSAPVTSLESTVRVLGLKFNYIGPASVNVRRLPTSVSYVPSMGLVCLGNAAYQPGASQRILELFWMTDFSSTFGELGLQGVDEPIPVSRLSLNPTLMGAHWMVRR